MLAKRIIPCLDVKEGRVVKGVNFVGLRDAGDPVEQAKAYDEMGADELIFLDISATHEGKETMLDVVRRVAEQVFLPLTVGGGIRSVEDDMGLVYQPEMKAGDVLFFAETMTHGTLPWTSDGERRSVLYKYASRAAARAVGKHFTPQERYGEWVDQLTPEQQAVLYGPGVHHGNRLPTLESDGQTVKIPE